MFSLSTPQLLTEGKDLQAEIVAGAEKSAEAIEEAGDGIMSSDL